MPAEKPRSEPRISVHVAPDRLSAVVSVQAGDPVSESELNEALTKGGVKAGIEPVAFARLAAGLSDPAFEVRRELIAKGCLAEEGEHGRFESSFAVGLLPGHVREDGTIDFHDRELLKPVEKGELLGQVHPARAGNPGCLVDGTPIPAAAVREATLALGPGAERDANGGVRAARAGVVICKGGESIDVVDQHVHQGAVDLHSGHLHMQGSLVVKGDVERTFSVYATGDVEIRGNVDNGNVYAGGDVRVKFGVRGGDGSSVCAEGNLSVHHAEGAKLYAGRLLQIAEVTHSELSAGRVEVSGKLRGGVTRAEFSIIARELGSPRGTETELSVAEPFELPVENAQRLLERAKALRSAKTMGPSRSRVSERPKGGKVGRVQAALGSADIERLAERAARRETLGRVAFIEFGIAHPGVSLRILDRSLVLEREMRASRVRIDAETGDLRSEKAGS